MSYIKEKISRTIEEEIDVLVCDRCKKKPKEKAVNIGCYHMNETDDKKWICGNRNTYHLCKSCMWEFKVDFMRIPEEETDV